MMTNAEARHLYIHVPFCAHICAYCDFVHAVYQSSLSDQWLKAIEKEIRASSIPTDLDTVYIGGGTPTALTASQLDQLLCLLDPYTSAVKEYTIEINPETLNNEKAVIIADHGINRASIGFQSSDPSLLKLMGRKHTMETMKACMELLHEHGIHNISLDLLYSLPSQTMSQLKTSLYDALSLHPTHLSLYSLTIEENSVFGKRGYEHLDEDSEADMYEWIVETLKQEGYEQYEVSNFAKDGNVSLHNIGYWQYDDFIGIGAGASGKENGSRYDHTRSITQYIHDPLHKEMIPLDIEDQMFESLMMGVRMKTGMDLSLFEERFHESFTHHYGKILDDMIRQGHMEIMDGRLRITDRSYEIMNSLLVEFM